MLRSLTRVWPLLLVLALFAAPASADLYYVTLTNGQVIQTAHQPQQASWDPNMVLMMTEVGNWVGFPKDQIQGVRVEDPTQGYGIKISDKAIALGRSPNDLPVSDDSTKSRADQLTERYLSLAERQMQLQEERRNYSVQQFAEPSGSAGIPLMSYGAGSGAVSGYGGGMYPGGGAPTDVNGSPSATDFGGLSNASNAGSPPQQ